MTDKMRRPLDPAAVRAADDAFYAKHPERVANGQRRPISRSDPEFADQSAEWRELYAANGGPMEGAEDAWASPTRPVDSVQESCTLTSITIQLRYDEEGQPAFPSERYEMVLSNSEERKDTLSGGSLTVSKIPPGTCSIKFVDWKSASP